MSLLSTQFFIFYFVGFNLMAMAYRMAGSIASIGILAAFAAMPGLTIWWVVHAHRRGRFAAIRHDALFVRNFDELERIPWPECSMVALDDIQPWLKQKGQDRTVSLRGFFDSDVERKLFGQVISAVRSGGDFVDVIAQQSMSEKLSSPAKGDRTTLIRVGVSIMVFGVLLMIGNVMFGPGRFSLVCVGVSIFWAGAIAALIGYWRSDRKA
ncbi:MAG TPA: hypothetical protein VJZ71_00865 [Phycisphaerae bacterium]|nr:hypothetical protein [Phycisphaerae bacterium]